MNRDANRPPLISLVAAKSGTGKTTVLEAVVARLSSQGYKVATLKHVHDQAHLDLPGKDSWKHRAAGASAVGLMTPEEFLIIGAKPEGGPRDLLKYLPAADLVLAEGFRAAGLPKIEVVRAELGREITTPVMELLAIVSDVPDLAAPVPVFPLGRPDALAEWLRERFLAAPPPEVQPLTHFDAEGRARMVDVSAKAATLREAVAKGSIRMRPETLTLIENGAIAKGDVLGVAQVAAIMAVKETSRLIPMCHPLNISGVEAGFRIDRDRSEIEITVRVRLTGSTGVEMEALTGVSVAALTIYDMCKAADKTMTIENIRLVEKSGGRSGVFRREEG